MDMIKITKTTPVNSQTSRSKFSFKIATSRQKEEIKKVDLPESEQKVTINLSHFNDIWKVLKKPYFVEIKLCKIQLNFLY